MAWSFASCWTARSCAPNGASDTIRRSSSRTVGALAWWIGAGCHCARSPSTAAERDARDWTKRHDCEKMPAEPLGRMPHAICRLVRRKTAFKALAGLAVLAAFAGATAPAADQLVATPDDPFIVKPYLQLGDLPRLSPTEPVRVLWQAANDADAKWTVDVRQRDSEPWRSAIATGGRLDRHGRWSLPAVQRAADAARARPRVRVSRLEERHRSSSPRRARRAHPPISRTASRSPATPAPTPNRRDASSIRCTGRSRTSSPLPATSSIRPAGWSSIAQKYFPIYNADVAEPRDRRAADSLAAVVRRLRQSRRRHRRSRSRSRRPGVFPDVGVPAERPVHAARAAEYPGDQRTAGPPQGPPRDHSVDLSADGQLLLRLRQLALDVPRFERLRRLVGCLPAQLAGAGSGGGDATRPGSSWSFTTRRSIRRARISPSSRCA